MELYIASKDQNKAALLMAELTSDGHKITARWITLDTKFATGIENYSDDELRSLAEMDEKDVRAATGGLVLIAEPEGILVKGGKHVETGIAIALGRPVFVVGRRENVF